MTGKLKIYIGMSAGVGKTYRMLQDAHTLLKNGVNVQIGYVETHNRAETQNLLKGLPIIARRKTFYKGKQLDELDVNTILILKPEWVIVDELAHTNIPGSKNEKRWQDVLDILNEGINVITAVNIQHIESINEEIQKIAGIEVSERVPDSFLKQADEVVNRKGATYYGIAMVVADIVEAISFNQNKIIPVSARLNNWNGVDNVCLGAPAVIGNVGVVKSWEVELTPIEKEKLKKSAEIIKQYL